MIEATYTLTADDLTEAGTSSLASAGELRTTRVRAELLAIGIGLIAIVLTQKPSPIYWLMLLGLFFIGRAIAYPGRTLRKHFAKSVTNEKISTQVSDEGLASQSETSRLEIRWSGFRSVTYTANTIALLTIGNTVLVLPKRAFAENDLVELRAMIARHGIVPSKISSP